VEAFGFCYYNVTVYRQPALSRHLSSILILYRRGGSDLNELGLVVRALVPKISVILVGEGRGDLSVVNCRVTVPVTSPGGFALGGDQFKLLVEGKSEEDIRFRGSSAGSVP
jgi:hypothetical protein